MHPINRNPIRAAFRRLRSRLGRWPDSFLWDCDGVVHIGANTGQEREMYRSLDLQVLWVEPIPSVFAQLQNNLRGFPQQRAVQALVADTDGGEVTLHIASNNGESSSILAPAGHLQSWPDVRFDQEIKLPTITLPSLLKRERITLTHRSALVLDTQGAELMILQGAAALLPSFRYVKAEGADYVAYEGCPTIEVLDAFMSKRGFRKHGEFPGERSSRHRVVLRPRLPGLSSRVLEIFAGSDKPRVWYLRTGFFLNLALSWSRQVVLKIYDPKRVAAASEIGNVL